jgi:hypothetical protein
MPFITTDCVKKQHEATTVQLHYDTLYVVDSVLEKSLTVVTRSRSVYDQG